MFDRIITIITVVITGILGVLGSALAGGALISALGGATKADLAQIKISVPPGSPVDLPAGAVVAFDLPDGCPAGWDEFGDVAGRTIVGAGSGMTDRNNQLLSGRKYREHGGEEAHTLTIKEMPAHNHDTRVNQLRSERPNSAITGGFKEALVGVEWRQLPTAKSSFEGHSEPHNNMLPYIALHFCKYEGSRA